MKHYEKINTESRFDTVIVADGAFPKGDVALNILRHARHIIACDGAAKTLLSQGFEPTGITVIGDGDSLSEELKAQLHFIQIEEQDSNDLTKATRHYIAQPTTVSGSRIAFLGATGKREDHTLANISLMMRYYREMNIQPVMITDDGYFIPSDGASSFTTFVGQQVSIFNFGCRQLESEGLVWNVFPFDELWQGTLNEAEKTTIKFKGDGYYLVYLTFQGKRHYV